MKVTKLQIVENLFILSICILIFSGTLSYSHWSQVSILEDQNITQILNIINEKLRIYHPHALRISLVGSLYIISDIISIDRQIVFSLAVVSCLLGTYKIINYIGTPSTLLSLLILLFLMCLWSQMNGRIAFAIYGNSILMYAFYKKTHEKKFNNIKLIVLVMFGLYLCSVSSGTTFVAIGFLLSYSFLNFLINLPKIKKKAFSIILVSLSLIIITQPFLMVYFYKNLYFYDGSVIKMMQHGMGRYFNMHMIFLLIPLFFIAYLIFKIIQKFHRILLPFAMVLSASFIGIFGFSSFVSGMSGFILLLLIYKQMVNTKSYSTNDTNN